MKNKTRKICFIVLVSLFTTLWLTSLVFLGFATLSDSITKSIETWYSTTFENKTLELINVSLWSTLLTTFALTLTLLFKEIKKRYNVR